MDMRWMNGLAGCAMAMLMSLPASAQEPARLNCAIGPAYRNFGGVKWLVYACDDGGSVVLVAPEGSAAAPFHFLLQDQAGEAADAELEEIGRAHV